MEATDRTDEQSQKYDLSSAQAVNFAETVQGHQTGSTINNYSANLNDITRLITNLRESAQAFPNEQREDIVLELDDLEIDVNNPEPDQNRIARRLKRLAAITMTLGAIVGGTDTLSDHLNTFAGNVIALTQMLGIPLDRM
ncbi:MAG: hypothetical protein AAFU71_02585 [Cyanobacteria bacterium J06632_22]